MKIVSLLPSATEILFAIGAGDDVVGVTHECDFPPQARSLPHLTSSALPQAGRSADIDRHVRAMLHGGSSIYHLDAGLLERLGPDLVVTQELCEVCAVSYSIVDRAARRLASDPRIISLEPSSLEDVFANVMTLGTLTHREREARELVASLRERIAACHARVPDRKPVPKVLVLEWTDPPMSGGHWTPGLVELAGGVPVLGNPGENSRVLSWDEIDAANADCIIVAPCGFDLEKTREAVAEVPQLQRENVRLVDGNAYVNRPGPRLVDTVEIFASLLHPEMSDVIQTQ
ncbi:MAG TPA: cobalamin-binding protein [Candidatus Baltobacteraceae bacterium]|nr:cobalamin-binding protein [Candidatus Baltobacteraceae bacterium]